MKVIKTINSILLPMIVFTSLSIYPIENVAEAEEKETTFYYVEAEEVDRVEVLREFFNKYDSDLADNADTFVEVADQYGIDYKLLPAISCMESTCGKFLIEGSYNPFGWGIYGNNAIYFDNYDHAIQEVGKGIYEGYVAKGYDTAEEIAPIYTPPNHRNWLSGVKYFKNEINKIEKDLS